MTGFALRGRVAATGRPSLRRRDEAPVEWREDAGLVPYPEAVAAMDARAAAIRRGEAPELVWLLQHPPLYTAGTSTPSGQGPMRLPLHASGRGGQITYHGPGQRIAYVMLDLQARGADIRGFVAGLERWLSDTLDVFGIEGERRDDRVGVWVRRPDKPVGPEGAPAEDKIAAIGVRVRRWVTFHGVSLNVSPVLSHYEGIVPCGIGERHLGVTSLADLGCEATMTEVDEALRASFARVFG